MVLVEEAFDQMWLISKHRELKARLAQAKAGLKDDKKTAENVRKNVIRPARIIRQQNNFAQIVRESLILGHNGR